MQTDIIERFDDLSPQSRKKLSKQIERVQKDAQQLREQGRQLRQIKQVSSDKVVKVTQDQGLLVPGLRRTRLAASVVDDAGSEANAGLLGQFTQSGKDWSQNMLKRSGELTSSGLALAGSQFKAGQQTVLDRGNGVAQDVADLRGEAGLKLRKQGQHLAWKVDDWRDEVAYQLHKQGRHLSNNLADRREETAHKLRRQGRSIGRDLTDRRAETAHKLRRQGRSIGRDLVDRRDDVRHKLSRRGQQINQTLVERIGRFFEPVQKAWPAIGFLSGLVLAAGVTFWLVRRSLHQATNKADSQIEIPLRDERSNEPSGRPGGEVRYASKGGTAVATRKSGTGTEALSNFVGVQSTKKYYPIDHKPDAFDLVYFASEEAARAEGFTAAR